MSPDGTLVPKQLYASAAASEAGVRFYLPRYALRTSQGRLTSSLRFRASTDDPQGPLGWLTVEMVPDAPQDQQFELREIPHRVQLRLGYRLPVTNEGGQTVAAAPAVPGAAGGAGAKLWMPLGPLEMDKEKGGTCRFPFHSREEFDNLFQILTDPAHDACLQLEYEAKLGQWTSSTVVFSATQLHAGGTVATTGLTRARFATDAAELQRPPEPQVSISRLAAEPAALRMQPVGTTPVRMTPMVFKPAIPVRPVVARPVRPPVARPARVPIARPVRAPVDTPPIRPDRGEAGIPGGIWSEPVLVKKDVTETDEIQPFVFPLASHGYMFDVPEDPVKNRILLRNTITLARESVTFYQDSLFRGQVFYEPQEFRLSRYSTDPFAPSIIFAFTPRTGDGEPGSAPRADEAGASYDVRMAYWAAPYLAPKFMLAARQQFGPAAFAPLMPRSCALTLRLPDADGAGMSAMNRADATISFEDGIRDEFSMSQAQFERVFAGFVNPDGVGIEGTLNAVLSDGSSAELPLNLSLRENAGDVFDRTFKGPVPGAPGVFEVELRNRIESPVRIREVFAVPVAAGVTAFPEGGAPAVPVAPGSTASLRYRLVPESALLFDLEPSMDLEIELDLPRVHREITFNEVLSEQTRLVRVSIDPAFFEMPPAGMPALTSVKVDFESGESVELTKDTLQIDVGLVVPFLVRLMLRSGEEKDFSYGYQVTCTFADGTSVVSAPFVGMGNLEIIPEAT